MSLEIDEEDKALLLEALNCHAAAEGGGPDLTRLRALKLRIAEMKEPVPVRGICLKEIIAGVLCVKDKGHVELGDPLCSEYGNKKESDFPSRLAANPKAP